MSSVRDIQENFQEYILHGDTNIISHICDAENMKAADRVNLYKVGYALRLLEILEKDFPGLKLIMGDELFEEIGRDYIDSFPSNHYSIIYFSRHFSKYLSSHEKVQPVYIEMASFEWHLGQVLLASDAPQLSISDLAQVDPQAWAAMRLEFHPSLRTIELFYNTPQIWNTVHEEHKSVPTIERTDKPVAWMVWRKDLQSFFVSLDEHRYWMLSELQDGKNFSEICEGLSEWMEEEQVAQFAAFTLRDWFGDGIISKVII